MIVRLGSAISTRTGPGERQSFAQVEFLFFCFGKISMFLFTGQFPDVLPRRQGPDPSRVVFRCRHDAQPVGAECRAVDPLPVSGEFYAAPGRSPYPRSAPSCPLKPSRCADIGAERRAKTRSRCPVSLRNSCPLSVSQIRAVLSAEAVTMRRPSALNAALWTNASWPVSARSSRPLSVSQIRAVRPLTPSRCAARRR